jgi:hypothetical protein
MFRDPDEYNPYRDYIHVDNVPDLSEVKDALKIIAKELYSDGLININKIDEELSWIADELGFRLPAGKPNIQRKQSELFQYGLELIKNHSNLVA